MALKLGLDRYIMAESIDVRHNDNVLCDVCEAVIGACIWTADCETAIHLCSSTGGRWWTPIPARPKTPSTALQEAAHEKD